MMEAWHTPDNTFYLMPLLIIMVVGALIVGDGYATVGYHYFDTPIEAPVADHRFEWFMLADTIVNA